jgi:hypothetical protein
LNIQNVEDKREETGYRDRRERRLELSIQATSPWIENAPKEGIGDPADQPHIPRDPIGWED